MRGLTPIEHELLVDAAGPIECQGTDPELFTLSDREEIRAHDRLVLRGLIGLEPVCACGTLHPYATAAGKLALEIHAALQTTWRAGR